MSLPAGRADQSALVREIETLREENALLRGVLNVLRTDLQIKDDQIENLFQRFRSCKAYPSPARSCVPLQASECSVRSVAKDVRKANRSSTDKSFGYDGASAKLGLIAALNDDVLTRIFSFLDILGNLNIRRTCTRFSNLSKSGMNQYWENAWRAIHGWVPRGSSHAISSGSSLQWKQALRWYQIGSRPVVTTLIGHKGSVTALAFAEQNDRELLVSGSDNGSLIVWAISDEKTVSLRDDDISKPVIMQQHHRQSKGENVSRLHSLNGHHGPVWGVSVDGNTVCSGSYDKTIKIWELSSGNCLHTLRGHENWVSCVSLKNGTIISGSWDSTVRIWHIDGPEQARFQGALPTAQGNAVYALDRLDQWVATGSHIGFEIFDITTRQLVRRLEGAQAGMTYAVHFQSPDLLATGGSEGKVRIWDTRSAPLAATVDIMAHSKPVLGLKMGSPDWAPYRLVTCSMDYTVKVFDIRFAGKPQEELPGWLTLRGKRYSGETQFQVHSDAVFALCLDNNKVCSGGADGAIKVFRF